MWAYTAHSDHEIGRFGHTRDEGRLVARKYFCAGGGPSNSNSNKTAKEAAHTKAGGGPYRLKLYAS